ncbi:MAG TPA: DUF1854 domain-containing protein [Capsulimonadaceae bacterium]|jgi:hypothetical protein
MRDSEPVIADAFNVTVLEPSAVRFFHAPDGDARLRVELIGDRSFIDARLARALPLSDPDHYLTIRDGQDKEIGVVKDWLLLETSSLAVVRDSLDRSYFLPKVLVVHKVTDTMGLVVWDVETNYGRRRYTVRNIRDSSVSLSSKRVLMTDVEGERFEFPDIDKYSNAAIEVLLKVL